MFNQLHSLLYDPRRGWDPISPEYAEQYGLDAVTDIQLVRKFVEALSGLQGKRIADLGSGPGCYSLEFAKLGALVTCVDVSRTYLAMARERLKAAGFNGQYALGYMDWINATTNGGFDGIFSNVSWNYCMNDLSFAKQLLRATKPGGVIMIRETNEAFESKQGALRRLAYWLNRTFFWKIGHPHPPRGRIAMAFERLGSCEVSVDYTDPLVDLVLVRKISRIPVR